MMLNRTMRTHMHDTLFHRTCDHLEDVVPESLRGVLIRMVPEKDGHSVTFEWPVPPEWRAYRTSPCNYIGHFLGCEACQGMHGTHLDTGTRARGVRLRCSRREAGLRR